MMLTAMSLVAAGTSLWLTRRLDPSEPYLLFSIAGATAFWIRCTPSPLEWTFWLSFAPIVRIMQRSPATADVVLRTAAMAAATGVASLVLLFVRLIWTGAQQRKQAVVALFPAFLLPAYVLSAQHMLIIAQAIHSRTLDLYLYKLDGSLGFQPSFLIGSLFMHSHRLRWLCLIVYASLPLAMGVAYAASVDIKKGQWSIRLLTSFVVAGVLGWAFYNLFPATGPRFVFVDFPHFALPYSDLRRLLLEPIIVSQAIPRNAMPSLHMTWVILIWWNLRDLSSIYARIAALLYLILTALGTLGLGEHYLVDLIVAFPFALMVQSICSELPVHSRVRYLAFAASLGLTLSWEWMLRHADIFMVSKLLPWTAMISSVLATEVVRRRLLYQSEDCTRRRDGRVEQFDSLSVPAPIEA